MLEVLGQAIWPGAGGKVLSLAAMLSTVATLETTLIQVTRTMFSMGSDRTLAGAFGRTHPRWRTPWLATIVVAVVSLALFVLSNFLGSVGTIMTDAISAIGLQIAFYYGLAGIAVVISYRKEVLQFGAQHPADRPVATAWARCSCCGCSSRRSGSNDGARSTASGWARWRSASSR